MHKTMKYTSTSGNRYQYYRCRACGGMSKSRIPEDQPKMRFTQ